MTETTNNTAAKKPLKKFLSSEWINKNMNFFLFLSVLAVVYIANGHVADRTIRNINKTENELKELQFQYKTLKSEVMYKSEESQIIKAAEPLGLKISNEVPQRLQMIKK